MTLVSPPPPVLLWTVGATLVALAVGSIARLVALRKADPLVRRKRLASLRTWWLISLVVGAALLAGRLGLCVLMALASGMALREYSTLLGVRPGGRPSRLSLDAIVAVNFLLILFGQADVFLVFVPLGAFAVLAVIRLLRGEITGYVRWAAGLYWGTMVLVYGLSHAVFLLVLPQTTGGLAGPAGWFVYLVALTEINDIAQALTGRCFGSHKRHRIAPTVSPNKTWEGFVGGLAVTTGLAVLLAPWLTTLAATPLRLAGQNLAPPLLTPIVAGLLIAVSGFFGDINMSAVKRDAGVKDSSTFLPGMGGLIDRVDSLTFSAPAFVYFVKWVGSS